MGGNGREWEGTVLTNLSPLIYAYKQENIVLKGKALLDGQGDQWWTVMKELTKIYKKKP